MSSRGDWLAGKRVLLTGGHGFLGSRIAERLAGASCELLTPRHAELDLVNQEQTFRYVEAARPDLVIHCAAFYGGMRIHEIVPGRVYYENLMMGTNLMEAARRSGVRKWVSVGSDCAYPGYLDKEVLSEDDLWSGPPHETALGYGAVKRILWVQGVAYRKASGFNAIYVIPTNMYGPGDDFDFHSSHVVAALIRRVVEAKAADAPSIEVWGSGRPTRNFLYVEDAAEGILRAAERYDGADPLNLTTREGHSVRELVETIQDLIGYGGRIDWNTARPDGQLHKLLDVSRMRRVLGWEPQCSLREGLARTIEWYCRNKAAADAQHKLPDEIVGHHSRAL